MIQLSVRRCPDCSYVGPVGRFAGEDAELRCPRCGRELAGTFDPRLK